MKPSAIILYIFLKIIGLLMIVAIILTVMFPGTGFSNIECHGTLVDATGKPLANEPVLFYSRIDQSKYNYGDSATTDLHGRFQVIFQQEYTVTMLESVLKLHKTASPPFYFGFKLPAHYDGDPDKGDGHYFIVKVTPKGAIIDAVRENEKTFDKGASNRFRVSASLSRDAQKWHIDATIREALK